MTEDVKFIWFTGWFEAGKDGTEGVERDGASQDHNAACAIVAAEK